MISFKYSKIPKISRSGRIYGNGSSTSSGGVGGVSLTSWLENHFDLVDGTDLTVTQDLYISGNVYATADVWAYVAGAVSSDVFDNLLVDEPIIKDGVNNAIGLDYDDQTLDIVDGKLTVIGGGGGGSLDPTQDQTISGNWDFTTIPTINSYNILSLADIDTTPVSGAVSSAIASSWAYTHENSTGNSGHIPTAGASGQFLQYDGTWAIPVGTTYTPGLGLELISGEFKHREEAGFKHIPLGGVAGQVLKWSASGIAVWGDDQDTTYNVATTSVNGLMSATDKTKLNNIEANANNYIHPMGYAGDDYDVNTGELSDATVISKIDINITTDVSGHVSDANCSVTTREFTWADLGSKPEWAQYMGYDDVNGRVTISDDLHVTGNIYATADVWAYVAGAVASDVFDSLLVDAPIIKDELDNSIGLDYDDQTLDVVDGKLTVIGGGGGGTIDASQPLTISGLWNYTTVPTINSYEILAISDIDATPTSGAVSDVISSDWAYTHVNSTGQGGHVPSGGSAGQFLRQDGTWANVGTITSIATSGAITGGTITSTGTISHSTSAGYKHVPADSSLAGQYLRTDGNDGYYWSTLTIPTYEGGTNTGINIGGTNPKTVSFDMSLLYEGDQITIDNATHISLFSSPDTIKAPIGSVKLSMFDNDITYGAGNGLTETVGVSYNLGTPSTLSSLTLNNVTTNSHTHAITTGIATSNIVRVSVVGVVATDYARFTSSGLEGRSPSQVLSDIGAEPAISKSTGFLKWSGSAWTWDTNTYVTSSHEHDVLREPGSSTARIWATASGIDVVSTMYMNNNNITELGDITFNGGIKLEEYLGALNFYMSASSGGIALYDNDATPSLRGYLWSNADNTIGLFTASGEAAVRVVKDGATELYHNGGKKLETSTEGAKIYVNRSNGLTPALVNVVFGTDTPPDPTTVPTGTIWIKYTA